MLRLMMGRKEANESNYVREQRPFVDMASLHDGALETKNVARYLRGSWTIWR